MKNKAKFIKKAILISELTYSHEDDRLVYTKRHVNGRLVGIDFTQGEEYPQEAFGNDQRLLNYFRKTNNLFTTRNENINNIIGEWLNLNFAIDEIKDSDEYKLIMKEFDGYGGWHMIEEESQIRFGYKGHWAVLELDEDADEIKVHANTVQNLSYAQFEEFIKDIKYHCPGY